MGQEAATAVLRDFEYLTWLTLIIGLVGAVIWRFFSRKQASVSAKASGSLGVPTDHFSGADLVVLPMVLVKYSFALVVVATFVFSLPQRFLVWLGLAAETAIENPDLEGKLAETPELTPDLVFVDLMLNLMLVSLVMVMIQWVGRASPSQVFGLRLSKLSDWGKLIAWIVGGAVISIPVVEALGQLSHYGLLEIFGDLEAQVAVQSMRDAEEQPLMRFLLIINACVVAPIVEEVIFRGYLYGVLKRFTGPMFAAFIGASLFAVAHNNLPAILPLWGFALLLTLSYEGSRSLWVPIGIHAAFNVFQVVRLLGGES